MKEAIVANTHCENVGLSVRVELIIAKASVACGGYVAVEKLVLFW